MRKSDTEKTFELNTTKSISSNETQLYQPSKENLILLSNSRGTPDSEREMAGSIGELYFDKASGKFFRLSRHDDGVSFHGSYLSLYFVMNMDIGLTFAWRHCKPYIYQEICDRVRDQYPEDKLMGIIWEQGREGGPWQVVTVIDNQYLIMTITDPMNAGGTEGEIPPEYCGDRDAILKYLHKKYGLWGMKDEAFL